MQMETRFRRASGNFRLGIRKVTQQWGWIQEQTLPHRFTPDAIRVTNGAPWLGGQCEAAQTEVLGSALASRFQVGLWSVWRACGWDWAFLEIVESHSASLILLPLPGVDG